VKFEAAGGRVGNATTALAGVCWALAYRGSLQVINELSPPDRRAEVASSYYIAGFVGNLTPVIGVGVISAAANPTVANITFGCAIAAFASTALAYECLRRFGPGSSPRGASGRGVPRSKRLTP
jgi:hypothetical protein